MRKIDRKWALPRALFIFFLLLTPVLEPLFLKGREKFNVGSTVDEKLAYMGKRIFQKDPPVDLLFLGSSGIMTDIHAGVIQNVLQEGTDTPVFVENFGHFHFGVEADYLILKELVMNRGVKNLVLGIEPIRVDVPHRITRLLWNPLEEKLPPWVFRGLYAEKILYSLPAIIRSFYHRYDDDKNYLLELNNGSHPGQHAFSEDEEEINRDEPFVKISLRPPAFHLKDVTISRDSDQLQYIDTYSGFHDFYFNQIVALARTHKINVYFLFFPTIRERDGVEKIAAMRFIHDPGADVPYLGAPPVKLFGTRSREEMKKYFSNTFHLNENGMLYFTEALMPTWKEIYENTVR